VNNQLILFFNPSILPMQGDKCQS